MGAPPLQEDGPAAPACWLVVPHGSPTHNAAYTIQFSPALLRKTPGGSGGESTRAFNFELASQKFLSERMQREFTIKPMYRGKR